MAALVTLLLGYALLVVGAIPAGSAEVWPASPSHPGRGAAEPGVGWGSPRSGREPSVRSAEVIHKGARHVVLRDGMWMQPEPLLYLGLTNGDLSTPLGYSGVYAAGNPNAFVDVGGRWFEPTTALDAGSAVLGWADAAKSAWNGDVIGMVVDANFASMDTVSAMVPVVGGTSVATLGTKAAVKAEAKVLAKEAADAVVDLVKSKVDDVIGGASKGAKSGDARFIGQPDGTLVDTHSTPQGSYDQPGGGRTDVLQRKTTVPGCPTPTTRS